MNKFLGALMSGGLAASLMLLSGCGTTAREAAKRIDQTPQIMRQASDLIAADPELSRYPITVDGFKADMRVKGEVATDAQKSRAARMVWAVPGVHSVKNELDVKPSARK